MREVRQDTAARRNRREKLRRERIKKVKRMRATLCVGLLAFCVLAGVGVSRGVSQRRAEKERMEAQRVMAEEIKAVVMGAEAVSSSRMAEKELPDIVSIYGIYVGEAGWSHFFADNSYAMAPVGKYLTAFRATIQNQPEDMTGTLEYCVNSSGQGWLEWIENGNEAGDETGDETGERPLEAICARLTGELGEYYDVLYSVLQDNQWTAWVRNGEEAGRCGVGLRVDGVRMAVVKKSEEPAAAGNIDPGKPMVALTYDDGPSAGSTSKILATLKENGAHATFFMVGQQVEKNMGMVSKMVEQGCEVGNHTYGHKSMSKITPEEFSAQLIQTNRVVSDACGVSPVLMRPCGGDRCDAGMDVLGSVSMPAVLWSIDTLDWKTKDAQNTVQVVLEQVKDGDIILMHDLYDSTAEASAILIPELINRGYQLVTVSEMASYRGGMLPGKTYSRFRPVEQQPEKTTAAEETAAQN